MLDGIPLAGRETGFDDERRGRNLRYFGFLAITGVLFIEVMRQRFYGNDASAYLSLDEWYFLPVVIPDVPDLVMFDDLIELRY